MPIRSRLLDVAVPLIAVGATALPARLLTSGDDGTAPFYLVALAVTILTALWRPSLVGSLGAWLGWSVGVAAGWLVDTGEFWLSGPLAYGFGVAFVPHIVASLVRVRLRKRAAA